MRSVSKILIALSLTAAVGAHADSSKLDPLARRALASVRAGVSLEALRDARVSVNHARELDVFIVGPVSRADLEAAGVRVRTALPGIVTAWASPTALDRVAALPDVVRIQGATRVEPLLDASVPTTAASMNRGPGPDFVGINGTGVLVGAVDTGIDFDHSDFKNPDGTTRLINIWDQTDAIGPPPLGYGYGTQWTAADINAGLLREVDPEGHGTHVLGIAAGDGSATGGAVSSFTYIGMAPKADLAMVKTDFSTGILDGVAYIMNRATALGKNAVVNLSLGSLFGPKDGTSAFETGLNALTGPGHIVVVAAGNSRSKRVHAEVTAPPSGSTQATLNVISSAAGSAIGIDGYYEAGGNVTMTVRTPSGMVLGPVALGSQNAGYPGPLTPNGNVYFENGVSLTSTGDREVYVELNIPNPNGTGASLMGLWTFTFNNTSGSSPVEVDLWNFYKNVGANFDAGSQDQELVLEPANAAEVVTVAAWISKNQWIDCGDRSVGYGSLWPVGALALFSSPGPTRDGREKPDIAAPGIGIGSAASFDVPVTCPATDSNSLNDGMQHVIMEGTSMAAPHVAGAVALLLQKYGSMTPAQVKSFLNARAIVDGFTGGIWNADWGHGKLFLGDLTDPVAQVSSPNGGESLPTGSTAKLTWSAADAYQGVTTVDLELSRDGDASFETLALGVANTGSYEWTVSGPTTSQARLRVSARDAAGNTGSDSSDGVFAITAPVGAPPVAITDFDLALRSPNPSAGSVEVEFAVPYEAAVRVAIFDLAGRRVALLADGVRAPGIYRAHWHAAANSRRRAGVYFLRLTAPGHVLARRLVVAG